jgi:uncharacterized membrane protein YhiD involved in acid resistance
MDYTARAIIIGLSFVLVFLSGLWVSRKGRPLNAGLSTVHKLVSLAAGVFLLVTVYQQGQIAPLNTAEWLAIAVTGVCFAAVVASGGILSSDKPRPTALLRVHQVVPVLTLISTGVMLYLVLSP